MCYLRQALKKQPAYSATVKEKWAGPDGSFSCLSGDEEFRVLIGTSGTSPSAEIEIIVGV